MVFMLSFPGLPRGSPGIPWAPEGAGHPSFSGVGVVGGTAAALCSAPAARAASASESASLPARLMAPPPPSPACQEETVKRPVFAHVHGGLDVGSQSVEVWQCKQGVSLRDPCDFLTEFPHFIRAAAEAQDGGSGSPRSVMTEQGLVTPSRVSPAFFMPQDPPGGCLASTSDPGEWRVI